MKVIRIPTGKFVLIVSDIHLGSSSSAVKTFLSVLKSLNFWLLIINGDLYDGDESFSKEEQAALDFLKENPKIVWFNRGNHDGVMKVWHKKNLGIKMQRKCILAANGKRICVIHGHQFDKWWQRVFKPRTLDKAFVLLMKVLRKVTIFRKWIHHFHKGHAGNGRGRAITFAKRGKFDGIVCSHFHLSEKSETVFEDGQKVTYVNSGSFVKESLCSYAIVDDQGEIELCYVNMVD